MKRIDTLFLDRDGVINRKLENDYVKHFGEFEFIEGVLDGLAILKDFCKRIIIITNQKGIYKGLMTEQDLLDIHYKMLETIRIHNGEILDIYFCPEGSDSHPNRKPNEGMFLNAKKDYPDIFLGKNSFMVGDSMTDMIPAKKLGLTTVYLGSDKDWGISLIDYKFDSLMDWAFALRNEYC